MDWYTGDTHFLHNNIIRYAERPFSDVNHMTEVLVSNWNDRVAPEDRVFHVGDFGFGGHEGLQKIFDRLNGQKHLIVGNHDKTGRQIKGWNWVHPYHELKSDGQDIVLCHYAMRVWNKSHYGAWMLFGHSHGSLPDDPHALSIDVGVDCHEYAPISTRDIARIMRKKTPQTVDHHTHRSD